MTDNNLRLTCLRISNHGLDPSQLPERIKLLSWGENKSTKGPVIVGPKTLTALAVNQARRGYDKVALDYEHNTVPGTRAYKESTEPRSVAAYGVPVVVEGEGLFLENMTYTPSGVQKAREYIDLSPAVQQDDKGEVVFIHSSALCRQGSVEDLSFYNVDLEVSEVPEDMEAVRTELDKMSKAVGALSEKLFELEGKLSKKEGDEVLDDVTANTVKSLSEKVTTLSTTFDDVRRSQVLDAARAEGKKLPPKTVTDKLDLTALSALVDDLEPGRIPVTRLTPDNVHEKPSTHTADDDTNHAVQVRTRAHAISEEHPGWSWTRCFNAAEAEITTTKD